MELGKALLQDLFQFSQIKGRFGLSQHHHIDIRFQPLQLAIITNGWFTPGKRPPHIQIEILPWQILKDNVFGLMQMLAN